jgi:hypothetical protein
MFAIQTKRYLFPVGRRTEGIKSLHVRWQAWATEPAQDEAVVEGLAISIGLANGFIFAPVAIGCRSRRC